MYKSTNIFRAVKFFHFFLIFSLLGTVVSLPAVGIVQAAPVRDPEPASVVEVGEPRPLAAVANLFLTKSIDGKPSTAEVGDILFYRIRFQCSSLTTDCGEMEITDVLPTHPSDGSQIFTWIESQSSVPAGFTMQENTPGTITITKDDNLLLDGSQADAVIAVRVNYDARPLPANGIVNTVTGRVKPPSEDWQIPVTATSPSIDLKAISVSNGWTLTKELYSPTVNPTVDTDVTYRLRLCPTQTSGNVELNNVVITDTLPSNARFINATGAVGTVNYTPATLPDQGGTVVWDIAGPVTPPDCATRYITLRYNSTDGYNVGDDLTNTADATAEYLDNDGFVCSPPCYDSGQVDKTHPIDPIVDTPTYSKANTGDPVGWTGTARFVLSLNTNGTNYPANSVTLIDNLPPQFEVKQVTSGAWTQQLDGDDKFAHVRATLQYATIINPAESDWVNFPGAQPVAYDADVEYDVALLGLPTNITAVRWVFEYDDVNGVTQPGLPYDWSFDSAPQIRVSPRQTATTDDDTPANPMPAAVKGDLYTNNLCVTRIKSDGNPENMPCETSSLTVQGDFVSLSLSKEETPGGGYDVVDDPYISNFVKDSKILPNDTLRYVINVAVTERSSIDWNDPVVQDKLPDDLIFVRMGEVNLAGTVIEESSPSNPDVGWVLTKTAGSDPTEPNAGATLNWSFDAPVTMLHKEYGSTTLSIEFFARVPPGTAPQNYTNTVSAVGDATAVICEAGTSPADSSDVDNDGDTTETLCENTDIYKVERSAALRGEKWIRSIDPANSEIIHYQTFSPLPLSTTLPTPSTSCPDGGTQGITNITTNAFTRYPCVAQAYPDGALAPNDFVPPAPAGVDSYDDFEYNLRIFNEGNVPMLRYVLYDILPSYGDNGSGGVLVDSARLSEFRPVMTGAIVFINGQGLTSADFEILYNASENPCRPEVFDEYTNPNVPSGCSNAWLDETQAASLGWENIRSYKIRLRDEDTYTVDPATPAIAAAVPAGSELRFGVPMSILEDAPPVGFDLNDAQTREIAWNSFAHVGAYDHDENPATDAIDLLASEPRKVGITIPAKLSIGNRVWRDSDDSGTINAADDADPGIGGVIVNLYLASDLSTPIATTTTDIAYIDGSGVYHPAGYYLFSNLPQGDYVVGIPPENFKTDDPDGAGPLTTGALYNMVSSTGAGAYPTAIDVTNPPDDGTILPAFNDDKQDHGIDAATPAVSGVFSATINLTFYDEVFGETDLSADADDGFEGARRGVNAELDQSSDLTVDFGFFGGTAIPFSIGNHVWKDNGVAAGHINNGVFDADESPVAGVRVELYRDGNLNDTPEAIELMRFDVTDANGFYLFDNLDPGEYYVHIIEENFKDTNYDFNGDGTATAPALTGWYSSQGDVAVEANTNDMDDNGIDSNYPETYGIWSTVIVLERDASGNPNPTEPTNEDHLSQENDPGGSPTDVNPTAWDGPYTTSPVDGSRGRFGETDESSNLTVDFGFIPPMSLGNRVWIDSGNTATGLNVDQYNNGIMDGTEVGVSGVRVAIYKNGSTTALATADTDANGYYLFERLEPGDYVVKIIASNFDVGGPLENYISSTGNQDADNDADLRDDGKDDTSYLTNGIVSDTVTLSYRTEPTNDDDLGPKAHGSYGQEDNDSNLSVDFGFVAPPRSLGNRVWYDDGNGTASRINNRVMDGTEQPISGVQVSLYLDVVVNTTGLPGTDGIPDDVNGDTFFNQSDAIRTDLTDAGGYYLFDNLPPARYLIGVDADNFNNTGVGDTLTKLVGYTSSTGNVDNASNNNDKRDNGVDRVEPENPLVSPYGVLSTRINLTANPLTGLPTGESDLSGDTTDTGLANSPTAWDGPNSRGRYGETDANSDLTIDFGFYKPMSIGNRVFYDNGAGTNLNNGIMDGDESPIPGVRVELYRDNGDGSFVLGDETLVHWDVTDANGYYLFDNLSPRYKYFVHIPKGNFGDNYNNGVATLTHGALQGWYSSIPTGSETEDVDPSVGGTTDKLDIDDNGVNNKYPEANGITSGIIELVWETEPNTESQFSSATTNPGGNTADDYNPTSWDGPNARGRWNESDLNSNLTIDFGFIPPLSLGNRVWIDDGRDTTATAGFVLSNFNDGVMDINGADGELGVAGVDLNLYYDADGDGFYTNTNVDGINETLPYRTATTDASGYYLFDGLPEGKFKVEVAASNFTSTKPLEGYQSSKDQAAFDDEITDLNDNGVDDSDYLTNGIFSRTFTLSYTTMPTNDDDISGDTTAYGPNGIGRFGEVDASSNLTLDFGFVQTHSIGNIVWRDADNSGTINGPDDASPGIGGVTVNLYAGVDVIVNATGNPGNDGIPDDLTVLATTTTGSTSDDLGYYLFDNLPAGNYIVGIPASNFDQTTDALYGLRSSSGELPIDATYEIPVDGNPDISDHGIDPTSPTDAVYSPIIALGNNEPTGESNLPTSTTATQTLYGTNLRGRYNETDATSDLTVDFGFFGGTDVPFSIGNHLWFDDGRDDGVPGGEGVINDGIRQDDELPVVGARVELYRDGNNDGNLSPTEFMRFDVTDAKGFYLFDNLDPGKYYVLIPTGNFGDANFDANGDGTATTPVLKGWYSSHGHGIVESDPDDNDDNGIDVAKPESSGVVSTVIILARDTNNDPISEPTGETYLSDLSADLGLLHNPTAWDGPGSIGRFGELDNTSNMTIDFGFIPPMSIGNRVWIDNGTDGAGSVVFGEYNDGVMSAAESTNNGVEDVIVQLYKDDGITQTLLYSVNTDANGYYLFDRVQPTKAGETYIVKIDEDNFISSGALYQYVSSFDDGVTPTDDNVDIHDKGIDDAAPATNGILSPAFAMDYNIESTIESDIPADNSANVTAYGTDRIGRYDQANINSNLTLDG